MDADEDSRALALPDTKKYYPLATEVFGEEVETLVQEEDAQPITGTHTYRFLTCIVPLVIRNLRIPFFSRELQSLATILRVNWGVSYFEGELRCLELCG